MFACAEGGHISAAYTGKWQKDDVVTGQGKMVWWAHSDMRVMRCKTRELSGNGTM